MDVVSPSKTIGDTCARLAATCAQFAAVRAPRPECSAPDTSQGSLGPPSSTVIPAGAAKSAPTQPPTRPLLPPLPPPAPQASAFAAHAGNCHAAERSNGRVMRLPSKMTGGLSAAYDPIQVRLISYWLVTVGISSSAYLPPSPRAYSPANPTSYQAQGSQGLADVLEQFR